MASFSYLLSSPSQPTDVNDYLIRQSQTISFACALAVSSSNSELISNPTSCYFKTKISDAVSFVERAIAAWSYNSYFRDVFGSIVVFKDWLKSLPIDSVLYLNITELILNSPTPQEDITQLRLLSSKMERVIKEIETKSFTIFLKELRKVSYPLVNVPVTGDRDKDNEILLSEIRGGTNTPEEELALQLIGIDKNGKLLKAALDSTKLVKDDVDIDKNSINSNGELSIEPEFILTTTNMKKTLKALKDSGCLEINSSKEGYLLNLNGTVFELK